MITESTKLLWSESELNLVKTLYSNTPNAELLNLLPGRTLKAIQWQAGKLGVQKPYSRNNAEILLDRSPISSYWLGFCLADGHFNNKGHLIVTINEKDTNHLLNFSNYVGSTIMVLPAQKSTYGIFNMVRTQVSNKPVIRQLTERLSIKSNKTYYPPDLTSLSDEELVPLFIGFIDGDGCLSKHKIGGVVELKISIHSSWIPTLDYIVFRLNTLLGKEAFHSYLNPPKSRAIITCAQWPVLQYLKHKAIENNLPIMCRKWDLVTEELNSKQRFDVKRLEIFELYRDGVSRKEIRDITATSERFVDSVLLDIKRGNYVYN